MSFGSITNKYYNIGIQFLKVKIRICSIVLQKVKLYEILPYLTEFTMKLV